MLFFAIIILIMLDFFRDYLEKWGLLKKLDDL
jgi:hypothetical protein